MKNKPMLKNRLAIAVAGASCLGLLALPVQAFQLQFDNPDLTGRIDSDVTVGALMRSQDRSRELAANEDVLVMAQKGYSTQLNKNDANNNFDTGLSSLVGKITSELALDYQGSYGAFVRGTAFYDAVIMDGHDGGDLSGALPPPGQVGAPPPGTLARYAESSDYANNGTGDQFTRQAKSWAGRRARLLDAYIWGDFELYDRPLMVRAGRSVINWGEALFVQNGINSANYLDLAALRLPGAEIKEALLPLGSLYFSYGLTFNLSMEGFYQFEWKSSEDAPVGTYFSTHDAFPGYGANNVVIDGRLVAASAGVPGVSDAFANYTNQTYGAAIDGDYDYEQTQVTINRARDEEASNSGQFGLGFRYFADQLGGTEFGFYYTRTHAKLPVVGAAINDINVGGGAGAGGVAEMIDTAEYRMVYPEDIDMFGVSFSGNTPGIGWFPGLALSGEVAYRPKQPIINEVGDNLLQNMVQVSGAAGLAGVAPTLGDLTPHCMREKVGGSCLDPNDLVEEGKIYYAYDEAETFTTSLVSIMNITPRWGTDGMVWLMELGSESVHNLDRRNANGDRLYYNSTAAIAESEAEVRTPNDVYDTYLDRFSWGYRTALRVDYNDVMAGVSFKPSLFFSHDVEGNSPIGGNFMEGRRTATLSANFAYLNNMEFGLARTEFWGAGYSNKMRDRNYWSANFRYSF